MTREDAKAEINKVFEPAFANYIITALTDGATPSERKTGKWKKGGYCCGEREWICSICNASEWRTNRVPFCPWCGAKMESEG